MLLRGITLGVDAPLIDAAIEAAKSSSSEPGKLSPKVGAALRRRDGTIVTAFRGELAAGNHAEYTLLEKKLKEEDVTGCTLATTLEPCTSRKKHTPCSDHLIRRGVGIAIIGALDPNPAIYGLGYQKLVQSGIAVEFFPTDARNRVSEGSRDFLNSFSGNPAFEGRVRFDYEKTGGSFKLGNGPFLFDTRWSSAGHASIHCYNDGGVHLGVVPHEVITKIENAGAWIETAQRHFTPTEGEIVVGRNSLGHFIAMKILSVRTRVPRQQNAVLEFEYQITDHEEGDFRQAPSMPYLLNPPGG